MFLLLKMYKNSLQIMWLQMACMHHFWVHNVYFRRMHFHDNVPSEKILPMHKFFSIYQKKYDEKSNFNIHTFLHKKFSIICSANR